MFEVVELTALYSFGLTRRANSTVWKESDQIQLVGKPIGLIDLAFEMAAHGFYLDRARCERLSRPLKDHSVVVVLRQKEVEVHYPLPQGMLLLTCGSVMRLSM